VWDGTNQPGAGVRWVLNRSVWRTGFCDFWICDYGGLLMTDEGTIAAAA
jgi:hypothetical protein